MRHFKLTVAYDGTRLAGWQRQPNGPTVQAALEDALTPLLGHSTQIVGSGRTDAGVHALAQVASFRTTSDRPANVIERALRASLPDDIRLISAVEMPGPFHALRDARRKHYRYLLDDGEVAELFLSRYVWRQRRPLDGVAMRAAAAELIGEHDFVSFESAGSPRKTTVRNVMDLTVTRCGAGDPFRPSAWIEFGGKPRTLIGAGEGRAVRDGNSLSESEECGAGQGRAVENWSAGPTRHRGPTPPARPGMGISDDHDEVGPLIRIDIVANGFLYNMVRNIVGTLVEVGRGSRTPDWVATVRDARDRKQAGPTAPPTGLFLVAVDYGDGLISA